MDWGKGFENVMMTDEATGVLGRLGIVSEILELSNEAISRIERGMIMPNAIRLMELAEIFGCSASDLLGEGSPRNSD